MMNLLHIGVLSIVCKPEHEHTSCPKVEAVLGQSGGYTLNSLPLRTAREQLASRPPGKILESRSPLLPSRLPRCVCAFSLNSV